MSNRISKYWQVIFQNIEEYQQIANTETIELDRLEAAIQQVLDNAFVLTSDEQSIKRREKELNIQADTSTETLDFRKQRILNRYQTHPPFTLRWLQRQLDRLVGEGMTIVSVDYANRILFVTANIDDAPVFNEVQHLVETVKPANMIYQQLTSVRDVIGLEERIKKQDVIWNYVLGSWNLGQKPFADLGPEEVIK